MKNKRITNGWFYWLIMLFIIKILAGCGKQLTPPPPAYKFDNYAMIIDYYSKDTTILFNRIVWWHQDSIWKIETKQMLDTASDTWFYMCPTIEKPEGWIEHNYYTKNGKKIQPSKYPIEK